MSTSPCPTPTVSITTMSKPAASRMLTASWVVGAKPPRCPRVAMLRKKTPESNVWRPIRIRSPNKAPPVNGLVGSTAKTATLRCASRHNRVSRSTRQLLPTPGGPVTPTIVACPVCVCSKLIKRPDSEPSSSTIEMALATARVSPDNIWLVRFIDKLTCVMLHFVT